MEGTEQELFELIGRMYWELHITRRTLAEAQSEAPSLPDDAPSP